MPTHVRLILWVDCSGAILVGALLLVFADWLRPLFQFPPLLYFTIAAANGVYGTFSLVLASLPQRPLSLIATLAIANAFWGCACLIGAASMLGRASIFGMAHLILEGLVVFSLARIEWRHRAWLAAH
ncbi:MAG: hypothetical protein MUE46_09325 [Xanthomonadales bacterium]|nr:hypothetical protein [Xanthomonadales bacterium]